MKNDDLQTLVNITYSMSCRSSCQTKRTAAVKKLKLGKHKRPFVCRLHIKMLFHHHSELKTRQPAADAHTSDLKHISNTEITSCQHREHVHIHVWPNVCGHATIMYWLYCT